MTVTLKRWTIPVSAAVVVTGVVLLAVWLAGTGSGTGFRAHRPHVLHLASANNEATAMTATTADQPQPGNDPNQLTGTLPQGMPADQPLWRLRVASADDAQAVTDALQLSGTPTRVTGGWALRAADNRLIVRDDGSWSFGMDCSPDTPISNEDMTVGCAMASGIAVASPGSIGGGTVASPEPVPVPTYPPGPSDADARSAAGHLFDRLGLTDPTVVVYSGDPMSTVQVSPSVSSLQTSGWVTTAQVDGSGDIVAADGWLAGPTPGANYPVISAQRAFDLLQQQPRPMMELCAQRPDGKPGCADIPPTEVTGATLGVMLDHDGDQAVLVPAWLFTVKNQNEPVAQIAVDPSYLATS